MRGDSCTTSATTPGLACDVMTSDGRVRNAFRQSSRNLHRHSKHGYAVSDHAGVSFTYESLRGNEDGDSTRHEAH